MLRIILLIGLLLSTLLTIQAQDISIPPPVRDAAFDAAEAALGTRANNFRFEILDATTDSALGCPLVVSEALPLATTPYRVSLLYPDGIYVMLVSADARTVQLCDDKFGAAMTSKLPEDPNACTLTAQGAVPAYAAPDNRLAGVFSTVAGTTYTPLSRSADGNWYQVADQNNVVGWAEATSFATSGICDDLFIGSYTAPTTTAPCYVQAIGAFSNVRNQPTVEAAQVAQIFENGVFQASAQTPNSDWYFILPGWVSSTVVQTIGTCDGLPIDADRVGVGFAEADTPGAADATVAIALAEFACPPDFEGYLPPRIRVGFSTAAVQTGGVPNVLRNFPDVDDSIGARIGTIQPGRTLDRVINGPVCNQGIVWWQVEVDGQTGWTAESNAESDAYFLEARSATTPTSVPTQAAPATEAPTIAPSTDEETVSAEPTTVAQAAGVAASDSEFAFVLQQDANPLVDLELNTPDDTVLYAASETAGFGDGVGGLVTIWDVRNGQPTTQFDVTGGVLRVLQASAGQRSLVIAGGNGVVSVVDPNNLALLQLIETGSDARADEAQFALSDDGAGLIATRCADDACTTSDIQRYNTTDGSIGWTAQQPDHRVNGLALTDEVLVTVGDDGAQFWNPGDGTLLRSYTNPTGLALNAIALSPDGTRALLVGCETGDATRCTEGRVALLDATTATLLGVVTSHDDTILGVAYTPDGNTFATTDGAEIIVRNSNDGVEVARYAVPGTTITTFTFYRADSSVMLLAGTADGRIIAWML